MQDQRGTATGFSEILENYIFNQVHDHARVCTFARLLAISNPFIVIYLCRVRIFLPWDTKFYMICACAALSRLESANVEIRKWILLVGKWAKRQERRPHIKSKTTPSNANKTHRKEKKNIKTHRDGIHFLMNIVNNWKESKYCCLRTLRSDPLFVLAGNFSNLRSVLFCF